MAYVEYSANNSGGDWWLKDADWDALEAAGWRIQWIGMCPQYNEGNRQIEDGAPKLIRDGNSLFKRIGKTDGGGRLRWLGCVAKTAYKPNCNSLAEAAAEWERITGACSTDAGCPCCGQPHTFTLYDDKGKYVKSGPDISYTASW